MSDPASVMTRKGSLRRRVLNRRASLSAERQAAAARALREAVLAMPEAEMAGTVAAYWSVGTEPDSHSLVYALWKRGSYVLLPVLRPDADLDWACYEGPDSLREGPRGLCEPAETARGPGAVAAADLVIVPALGVDHRGVRLGRGGGSYDRALARVGSLVPTVALLHDGELFAAIPEGPHDRRVNRAARPCCGITSLPV